MARTPSRMIPLGSKAPSFTLPDVLSNEVVSLDDLRSDRALVVMFICNHCPFVKHVQDELARLAQEYGAKGIQFVAISSNDVAQYPDDSPEKMRELGQALHFTFPYLYDETQEVAKAYDAACTPDFFVYDKELRCVYRGQLDDSRPGGEVPVTGSDLRAALDAVLAGRPVNPDQKPSLGCNIKWKD
ncbi:MAG: thioredoxin family protein [Bdellovibrionales bacterium]|nr:thioredoxin family protein [Bdellovibrionales bacterium]